MRGRGAEAEALGGACRACARGLAAGLPVTDALAFAADAAEPALAPLLRDVAARLRAGVPASDAAASLGGLEGGELVRAALAVHAEVGGDLVAALRGVGTSLDARAAAVRERAAATAQARATARGAALLPAVALGLALVTAPQALRPLVTTAPGLLAVGVGGGLIGVGLRVAGSAR